MALQISENKGIYSLAGAINNLTVKNFKKYLSLVMENDSEVIINIDAVDEIDYSGLEALRELYRSFKSRNIPFFIIGQGCKEIYDDFRLV